MLQRALLVCWAACVPISAVLLHSETLLTHAGQQAGMAAAAAQYLHLLLPCLLLSSAAECLRQYLVAQQVVKPAMVATAAVSAAAPLFYWLFICK